MVSIYTAIKELILSQQIRRTFKKPPELFKALKGSKLELATNKDFEKWL